MKKIIGGKKYDTETATRVFEWDNSHLPNDFDYVEETLYRKRTGEYFIYGEGGPRTRYAQRDAGMWASGWAISPLSYDEAKSWMEEHADADSYESEFGEVSEGDDGAVAVTFRISERSRERLRREASRTGRSQSEIVDGLLQEL